MRGAVKKAKKFNPLGALVRFETAPILHCWLSQLPTGFVVMNDSNHERRRKADEKSMWFQAAEVGSVGIEMGLAVAVGYYGGKWLDQQLGTTPFLFYFMMLSGVGAAFKALWRIAAKTRRQLGSDTGNGNPPESGSRPSE